MAFPHPKSRKDHYRNEDIPSSGGVVWNLVKRTINITEYRNRKNDVNPAKDRPLDALAHDIAPTLQRRPRNSGNPGTCSPVPHPHSGLFRDLILPSLRLLAKPELP